MLAYVAVTRAQNILDREGLAWVDRWATGSSPDLRRSIAVECIVVDHQAPVAAAGEQPAVGEPVDPRAAAICWLCGTGACRCDPAEAAAYSARLLIPAGDEAARAAFLASHVHLGNGQWRKATDLIGARA